MIHAVRFQSNFSVALIHLSLTERILKEVISESMCGIGKEAHWAKHKLSYILQPRENKIGNLGVS